MCGILGSNFSSANFAVALKYLDKRGPDFKDIKEINNNLFGHTRLSIIDLDSEANQPMIFDDILIVFNGEIYNYDELIISENLICKTKSDTEVIIRLYQKYGDDFLNLLNGMFAFCIYDIKADRYFCARDRYGKKPLFYYYKDKKFIFSSSIKSILTLLEHKPNINKNALGEYLQYFAPIGENSFYQDIKKLEMGTFLKLENNQFITKKYYTIKTKKSIFFEDEALEAIEQTLIKSVEYRLKSDVEVGTLLSGGIDSSLISSIYSKISKQKINLFSVGYDEYENYDETNFAKITAKHLNANHHIHKISKKDFINSFDEVIEALEEPHADAAAIPLYCLTKEINKMGIKTVLSGEGSDELFLGYDNYAKFLKYYEFEKTLTNSQQEFLDEIIIALQNQTKESEYLRRIVKKETLYNSFGEIFTSIQKRKLFNKMPKAINEKPKKDAVDWMSYIDLKIWLGSGLLTKVDRVSMANSLEIRTPFLDYNLVDLAFSIDNHLRVGDTNKYLLKKVASKYIPKEIINRTKKGFNSPYNEWLFDEFKDNILDTILRVNNQTNYFNKEYLIQIYELAKSKKFKQHLYAIFFFSRWFEKEYL